MYEVLKGRVVAFVDSDGWRFGRVTRVVERKRGGLQRVTVQLAGDGNKGVGRYKGERRVLDARCLSATPWCGVYWRRNIRPVHEFVSSRS